MVVRSLTVKLILLLNPFDLLKIKKNYYLKNYEIIFFIIIKSIKKYTWLVKL